MLLQQRDDSPSKCRAAGKNCYKNSATREISKTGGGLKNPDLRHLWQVEICGHACRNSYTDYIDIEPRST